MKGKSWRWEMERWAGQGGHDGVLGNGKLGRTGGHGVLGNGKLGKAAGHGEVK